MSRALQKKLRITLATAIRTVSAPETLGALPKGTAISKGITKENAFIHLFAQK